MEKRPLFWLLYVTVALLVLVLFWGSVALVIWLCERCGWPQNVPIWVTSILLMCGFTGLSCWLVCRWPRDE